MSPDSSEERKHKQQPCGFHLPDRTLLLGCVSRRIRDTQTHTLFEWVGNSYMFNAVGYPAANGGLDGVKSTTVLSPARTVLFADNVVVYPANPTGWHRQSSAGNVLLVDGHEEFHTAQSVTNLIW